MKTETFAGKAIVRIPGWAEEYNNGQLSTQEVRNPQTAYAFVPLLFRAVSLRCDSLASTPIAIMRGEEEVDWPFDVDLYDLIWSTEAALLLSGAAFWLKLSNRVMPKDVQWVNPLSMKVDWINGQRVFQQISGDNVRVFNPGEIIYFREFNPTDDVGFGVSSTNVALCDAQLARYINLFASQFFKGGAMPVTMLGIEGLTDENEVKRLEGKFKQLMTGLRNAFRVLAVSKAVTPAVITPELNTMAFPELTDSSVRGIAYAFGIPLNMLLGDDNYASASEHRLGFYEDTIKPRYPRFEGVINKNLLKPMGLQLKFQYEQMDIYQRDVTESASALGSLVNAGYPLGMASQVLGIELPEGVDYAMLDALQEKKRKEEQEREDKQLQARGAAFGKSDDLSKWQKKAVKRVEQGKPAACAFESDNIPEVLAASITAQLEQAVTVDDVKAVFSGVWRGYP